MNFSYKKIPIIDIKRKRIVDYIYRPLLKIGIKTQLNSGNDFVDYEALIDSGADDCLFPEELAEIAKISIDKTKGKRFSGLGGSSMVGYPASVSISLGEYNFSTEIYFSSNLEGYGILGQKGFFDKFRIRFIYSKKMVEIVEERRR